MELVIYGLPIAAVVLGLTQVVKRALCSVMPEGWDSDPWMPLVAIAFGLFISCFARLDDPTLGTWFQAILMGVMTGLSASGLYSGQKAVRGG